MLPKFLQGKVGGFGDGEAPTEEELSVEFLEIRNSLLVHGLDDWRGVGRENLNFYIFKFLQ